MKLKGWPYFHICKQNVNNRKETIDMIHFFHWKLEFAALSFSLLQQVSTKYHCRKRRGEKNLLPGNPGYFVMVMAQMVQCCPKIKMVRSGFHAERIDLKIVFNYRLILQIVLDGFFFLEMLSILNHIFLKKTSSSRHCHLFLVDC